MDYRKIISIVLAIVLVFSIVGSVASHLSNVDGSEKDISSVKMNDDEDTLEQGSYDYVDSIEITVRTSENTGIGDTAEGDLDVFIQGVTGKRYEGISSEWKSQLGIWKSVGGYNNLLLNPAYNRTLDLPITQVGGEWQFNPFGIREVRYATNWLIDREMMIDDMYAGYGSARFNCFGQEYPGYDEYFRPIVEDLGITASGDFAEAESMIYNAMNDAKDNLAADGSHGELQNAGTSADPLWQYRSPSSGTWSNVSINGVIRIEDERTLEGNYFADQLESVGIQVNRMELEGATALGYAFYSDPADQEWHFYTGGWLASVAAKYQYWTVPQMYSSYYPYVPGGFGGWKYSNDTLYPIAEKLMQGRIKNTTHYWDLNQEGTRIGMEESVRVFTTTQYDYYVYDHDSVGSAVSNVVTGYDSVFTPRTIKTNDSDLRMAHYSSEGSLYMDNWNDIAGLSDTYGQAQRDIATDYAVINDPSTGEPMGMRASFETQNGISYDNEGNLEMQLDVPSDALTFNTETEVWEEVGSGVNAATAATYDWTDGGNHSIGTWHDGDNMTERDILANWAFHKDLAYDDGAGDKRYHSSFSSTNKGWYDSIIGIDWGTEDGKFTVYGDYTFPVDEMIGSYYSSTPSKPWQIVEAANEVVEGTALSATTDDYSWESIGGTKWVHFLSESQCQDFVDTMDNMITAGYIPEFLKEANNCPFPITTGEMESEINAIKGFYSTYSHLWDSQGPFVLTNSNKTNMIVEYERWTTADGYPIDDGHYEETTNLAPDAPTLWSPSDGDTGVSTSPTLSVNVSDPDSDVMDVKFYNGTGSLLGTVADVPSGESANLTLSGLDTGTTYHWYAVADDKSDSNTSDTWSFTTATGNSAPLAPDSPSPSEGATGIDTNPTLSVDVSDPDGDTMNVTFYNASDDSVIGWNHGLNDGTTSITWNGLIEGTTYEWYVTADDGDANVTSNTWSFTTKVASGNNPPSAPTNPDPEDSSTGVGLNPTLSVDVSDPDGDTMTITFYNASDDNVIGSNTGVTNGTTSVTWSGLDYDTTYTWYAVANDSVDESQSPTWSFQTIGDTHPPHVVSTTPTSVATDVSVSSDIVVEFNETMNTITVNQNFTYTDGSTTWDQSDGTVSWGDSDTVMTFAPDNNLPDSTTITVEVLGEDANGNELDGGIYTWDFTTEDLNDAPETPTDPVPEDDATDVPVSVTLEVNVTDPDDDSMDVTFYNASDDSEIGTDTGVANGSTASVTWSSLEGLTEYNWYAITNDSVLEAQSDTWTFTTKDVTPPTVINSTPEDGAVDVAVDQEITIEFSEAMDETSVEDNLTIDPHVNGSFSWSGDELTYTLDDEFEHYTEYEVTITSDAADENGVQMEDDYVFSFTTVEAPDYKPTLEINAPQQGETYDISTPIEINWTASDDNPLPSEPITIEVSYNGGTNWTTLSSTIENTGSHQWTPGQISTEVKVRITCEDSAGQTTTKTTGEFSVEDTTPPDVEDTIPNDEETDVDTDQEIVIEFDEEIDPDSVDGTVTADGEEVNGEWTLSDDNKTLMFTPSEELEPGAEYEVSVSAEDEFGNQGDHNSSFTTSEDTGEPASPGGMIGDYWWIIVVLIAAVVIGIVAFAATRKKGEEEEEYVPPEEEQTPPPPGAEEEFGGTASEEPAEPFEEEKFEY
ncbi:MAG: Ig-like domain-containing protein [Thermoplasmatota archaeon]